MIANLYKWKHFTDIYHVPDSTFLSHHFKINLIEIGQVKRKLSQKNLFFANVNYTVVEFRTQLDSKVNCDIYKGKYLWGGGEVVMGGK